MKIKKLIFVIVYFTLSCSTKEIKEENIEKEYLQLKNISIIDGKGTPIQSNKSIIIQNNKIFKIIENDNSSFDYKSKIIDCTNKFVIPGLYDTHTHATILNYDSINGHSDEVNFEASFHSLKYFIKYGVTTIRSVAGPTIESIKLRETIKKNSKIISPRIFCTGYALNTFSGGPFIKTSTEGEIRKEIKKQINSGVDFIKVYSSLNPKQIKIAIDEAHMHNVKVIGHLQNTSWTEASKLGIDFITHAADWNVNHLSKEYQQNYNPSMKGRLYWLENIDLDGKLINNMIYSMRKSKVIFDPTLIVFHTKFWGNNKLHIHNNLIRLMHPVIVNMWETGSYVKDWDSNDFILAQTLWSKLLALCKKIYDNKIILTTGSDTPNPWVIPGYSIHQEMQLLVEAGISENEVIKIATYNGALALNEENERGSVEELKIADLIILNSNPLLNIKNTLDIKYVIQNGELISN